MGNVIVCAVLAVIIFAIIFKMVNDKKAESCPAAETAQAVQAAVQKIQAVIFRPCLPLTV